MDAKGLLCFFSALGVPLAIGVVSMRLNNRKLLAVIAGLMVGGLLGFFLWMFWLAWTGNIMGDGSKEQTKAVTTAFIVIIGCTGIIGGLIGFVRSLLRSRK
jgi:hypothetical protein